MALSERTEDQEWVDRRVTEVGRAYNAYQALVEFGVEMADESSSQQVPCPLPGHGPDNRPSSRYYSASGRNPSHFYCFKEKLRLDGIGLYAHLKGMKFMEALSALERRFGVKVPKRPEGVPIAPSDRGDGYVSEAWGDVPRVLVILEGKLKRLRDKCGMAEYVKYCRLMDAVQWDFDVLGKPTPEMVAVLMKAAAAMDDAAVRDDSLE